LTGTRVTTIVIREIGGRRLSRAPNVSGWGFHVDRFVGFVIAATLF